MPFRQSCVGVCVAWTARKGRGSKGGGGYVCNLIGGWDGVGVCEGAPLHGGVRGNSLFASAGLDVIRVAEWDEAGAAQIWRERGVMLSLPSAASTVWHDLVWFHAT